MNRVKIDLIVAVDISDSLAVWICKIKVIFDQRPPRMSEALQAKSVCNTIKSAALPQLISRRQNITAKDVLAYNFFTHRLGI
jgi:hypothetical protein